MRRWIVGMVVLCTAAVAPLSAELKVVSKMSVRKVAGAAPAGDMMSQMMAPALSEMFGGEKGIEVVTIFHEDGRTRVEYAAGFASLPAGTVLLTRADGSIVGFDQKAGTWWKMPSSGDMPPEVAELMAQMKPEVVLKKTGEVETIAGQRAERSTMTMRMPIPLPPEAANAPPELLAMIPREITMEGETWMSPAFGKYTNAAAKAVAMGPLSQFGFDKVMESMDGLVLKQVVRMSMMAGYEMETLVLSAVDEDIADTVFDLPPGLKEVAMPGGGVMGAPAPVR